MNNEERLYRELSNFFKKLKKEVLASLEEYWSEYQMLQGHINLIVSPVHEAHKEYYEILRKYKVKEYELGKREATRLVNRAGVRYAFKEAMSMPISGFIKKDSDKLFGTLPKAEQDLLDRTYKASENTLKRVDSQLNQIITDGYRSGKGINDIANNVTKRFDQLASWEAKRIARTEVNTSHNKATVDTYNELGVEYTQWIAASDDRTRDSHVEVDGEIIPLGGHYSNGLAYPGDMSGPVEEWINCRCSNAPFVIPYGYMAPSFSPFREDDLIPIETHNPLEVTEPQPVTPIEAQNPIPQEVHNKMGEFGNAYEYSQREHIQFFTEGDTSETAHGMKGNVNLTGNQRQWLNKKAETQEEVHALHNHPTNENRKEGYTMFSDSDVQTFVRWNVKGSTRDIPINMKTNSAENQYNRVTVERLDNFHEVYRTGIKPEESLGRGTSYAIARAFKKQTEFYDKYHPAVTKGMEFKREMKSKLREQGLTSYEINQQMKKYEKKAKQIDEEWFEERQREFPKLIKAMNKELNPYGLNITSEYKTGVYANKNPNAPKPNVKSEKPKTKVSQEELDRLDMLKEQLEMAKKDLDRLPKSDPQYKTIQKMAINTRKKIKELEKKLK